MKIIAINGSPRRTGNTAAYLRKALEGAASVGAETECIDLYTLHYKGLLWSSVFVTRVSNQLMSNISFRMAYDIRYKNAVVHGCMWYKQNVPQSGRETPHLDTCEDKIPRSSAY